MSLHGITAKLLVPGRGEPIHNGTVIISGTTIAYVGSLTSLPSEYVSVPITRVPVIMPGLWDCHVHYIGNKDELGIGAYMSIPAALASARCSRDVTETLFAGYTSVREVGGWGIDLGQAINEGTLLGPNIYSSHAPLSQTGGHIDAHEKSISFVHECMASGKPIQLCDGVDECRKAVRMQLRRGAKLIKCCTSGGVLSEVDHPLHQQFSDEELKAIVEEAGRADRIVAAHTHGKNGILAALRAGCHTIEHGSYQDEECLEIMKVQGTILVATRLIMDGLAKGMHTMTAAGQAKLGDVQYASSDAYLRAINSGVKIALGSDLGPSKPGQYLSHGNNARELRFAVEHGMTPLQAIEAATATAPETLGPQAPKSGQIRTGYDADLIAVAQSPLEDITVLERKDNITHVWKGGMLYKSPEIRLPW
jgi:imidazolonepropionase-like amidohydrolase